MMLNTRKKKIFATLFSLVLVFTLVGCSKNANSPAPATEQPKEVEATAEVVQDKDLVIANGSDIEGFDPANNNNTYSEAVLINVFEYLVKNDRNQNKVPGLATEWTMVDETTWNFKLRNDVTFHNGDAFTAADVKFTYERLAQDSTLKQHTYFKHITAVNVINDYEVEFTTSYPDPIFLNRLSKMGAGVVPAKYIEENGVEHFLANPIGTGPYKYVSWKKDDRVELARNENYYGGEPKWDTVTFRTIPEAATRVSELLTSGVDIATAVPVTDIERINASEASKVESGTVQRVIHLIMRHTDGSPTADPRVREAIELAIDNQAIIDGISAGKGTPTRTSVTPGNFGSNPDLYNQYLYDLEKAKALLTEAGYSAGGPAITFSASTAYKEIAEVVTAFLQSAGFEVTLDLLEPSKFSETLNAKGFKDVFLLGVGNSLFDASNNYNRFLQANNAGETDWVNAEAEELLQAALSNMDPDSRTKQYQRVQEIISEDRPTIYLHQLDAIYGVAKNIEFNPRLDEMFIAEEINLQ